MVVTTTPKEKEKEIKVRRKPGRVPTSCSECRRLKLRCDRKVPCEKCVARGCGSICPDGSLAAGKGNRLVLANTQELHERIETLCSRIRELENALRTLQCSVSSDPHPLLSTDLLQIKAPLGSGQPVGATPKSPPAIPDRPYEKVVDNTNDDENFIDAYGTLTIGPQNEAKFLGPTARSEYLLRALSKPTRTAPVLSRVSQRVFASSCSDESSPPDSSIGSEIFALLPPLSEAISLCEIYEEHGKWMFYPFPRSMLFDGILANIYRADSFESTDCHILSLVFIIFAIACLFDQDRPDYSLEAQEYYYLSRAALGFLPPNQNTTATAISALVHISQYQELSDWRAIGTNSAWTTLGHAVRLGQSMGLHINPDRWNLSPEIKDCRSRIFWTLFYADTWSSFYYGRPPSFSPSFTDLSIPYPPDPSAPSNGEIGFHTWSFQFTTLLHTILATVFGPKNPSYATIVDLDKKVRDFPVPEHLRWPCPDDVERPVDIRIQRWFVVCTKETTLLNLHRGYLCQALQDQPNDLTNHRYVPSVMATYRSAWRLIAGLKWVYAKHPGMVSRMTLVWSQVLSAAIVMCILVTRAPTSKMTKVSLEELDNVAELFEQAAPTCRAAANNLETIQNLRNKAHAAVEQNQSSPHPTSVHSASPSAPSSANTPVTESPAGTETLPLSTAELDRLGGRTHLIAQQVSGSGSVTLVSHPSSSSCNSSPYQPSVNLNLNFLLSAENMHPTIAQDMRNLDEVASGLVHYTNMYDIPTESSRITDEQRMQDIQFTSPTSSSTSPGGTDSLFTGTFSTATPYHFSSGIFGGYGSAFGTGYGGGAGSGMAGQAPILDATWQSFVEQLGF